MKISQAAQTRIRDARLSGEGLSQILEMMAKTADSLGVESAQFAFDYQSADDVVEPGDLIPVITLSLRPATIKEAPNGMVGQPADSD